MSGPSRVHVVLSGVDTLHLFVRGELRSDLLDDLSDRREAARRAANRKCPRVTLGAFTLDLQLHSSRKGDFLLSGDLLTLVLNPKAPPPFPTVYAELRSKLLWEVGLDRAVEAAVHAMTATTVAEELDIQVTRVDLAVDFQDWIPRPADLDRFVTRARRDGSFREARDFTGFTFGKGDIVARLYDKSAELKKSGKRWFEPLWAKSVSYNPQAPVWRLEFQLRRGELDSLRDDSGLVLGSWSNLRSNLPGLFARCAKNWLALRAPRTGRTRQRLAPEWSAILEQATFDQLRAPRELFRIEKSQNEVRVLGQLAGYLSLELAHVWRRGNFQGDVDGALRRIGTLASRHAKRSGRTLEERAQAHLQRWAEDRAAIQGGGENNDG
jgi:hypothetical protein